MDVKKYKKIKIIFILSCFIAVIFAGKLTFNNSDKLDSMSNLERKHIMFVENSHIYNMNSLEDLIKYSDNIIVGTIAREERISKDTNKYTVNIEKNIKGDTDSPDIDVYEPRDTMQVGKKYLLFLGYFDSPLYSRAIYTSINKECIIEVENEKLAGKKKFINEAYDYKDIVKDIEKSSGIKLNNDSKSKYKIKNKYDNTKDLLAESDFAVQITPREVIKYNSYVAIIKADIAKQYKGNLRNMKEFILTSDMEVGKSYIVFFKKYNDSLVLASREGSIISEDDSKEWDKIIDELEKH